MTDLTTDVTVTIHGTEMDLIAEGDAICRAQPDVGIPSRHILDWELHFADGTLIPVELHNLLTWEEHQKVDDALDDALARGDFEPEQDVA